MPYGPYCSPQTLLMPTTLANSFAYNPQRTSSTVPTLSSFFLSAHLSVGGMLLTTLFIFPAFYSTSLSTLLQIGALYLTLVICRSTCLETMSPRWNHLQIIQACLPQWPPFSQHISWRCCNPPDILSSIAEILLFNSVFYDGVAPVSVSTLKPPLRAIGVLPLKSQASPILSVCI